MRVFIAALYAHNDQMSTPAAKDLLAQADRMMRQRVPEELPVLTDLIVEEIEIGDTEARASRLAAPPVIVRAQPSPGNCSPICAQTGAARPSPSALFWRRRGRQRGAAAGRPCRPRYDANHADFGANTATAGPPPASSSTRLLISWLEEMRLASTARSCSSWATPPAR